MSRPIILGAAAALLFALGVIAANTRVAQGWIPVTAYEADVNKDARVNSGDLGAVASKFNQPVPAATPTPVSYCNLSGRNFTPYADFSRLGGGTYGPPYGPGEGLNGCRFDGATFPGANFGFSSLRNAVFTNASLGACYCSWADFNGATFRGATIGFLDAPNASFQGTDLTGVELTSVIATGATFAGANLTNVVLSSDYLSAFEGANFAGAITTGAVATGVVYWGPNTTCPDGTNSDNNGGSCIGHGFAGTPLPTWTPTMAPTATATPDSCAGANSAARWTSGNNHCYLLFTTPPVSWTGAKSACESIGTYLVTIGTAEENTFVFDVFGPADRWIGFTDAAVEGQWEWVTGEPVTYTNWGAGEPNDGGGTYPFEDGALLQVGNGQWNDGYDGFTMSYVCERDT
jgi:uncharacterized protein YjbI with pentapeptide repeats